MYSCITLDNGSKHVLYLQVLIYCTYIAVLKCNFSIKKNGLKRYNAVCCSNLTHRSLVYTYVSLRSLHHFPFVVLVVIVCTSCPLSV